MENLRMPASYATLPEEELPEMFGGGELGDELDSFTDNLHLGFPARRPLRWEWRPS